MSRSTIKTPQPGIGLPDEPNQRSAPTKLDNLGLPVRSRDLGQSRGDTPHDILQTRAPGKQSTTPAGSNNPASAASAAATPPVEPDTDDRHRPAHENAYFNVDVVATAALNPRATPQQALRGTANVTDLRQIVLPQEAATEVPNAAHLYAASTRMALHAPPDFGDMLQRQGTLARQPHMTSDILAARLAQLHSMVEARLQALARMARLPQATRQSSATVQQAFDMQGQALSKTSDVAAAGTDLLHQANQQASGLHRRLMKTLGIKKKSP